MSQYFPLKTRCANLSGVPVQQGGDMTEAPDIPVWVIRVFAIPPSPPQAGNDNIFPPPARPKPPPLPPLTQRLDPGIPREVIGKGHRPALDDGAALQELRRRLWAYLDAVEQAEGRTVKQYPEALNEVMRMAREELDYPKLAPSRAQTEVVQVVWEMRNG
jgi:hypothetical protein